jgi:hypothetical protein
MNEDITSARYRPETEGRPPRSSVSRAHHGCGLSRDVTRSNISPIGAALGAAKPQLDQRHLGKPSIDEALQVSVRRVAARIAEPENADVTGARCGEVVVGPLTT